MKQPRRTWQIIVQGFLKWRADKTLQLGAALSFYTVLSLPALLVISIGIAGRFFGEGPARDEILRQTQDWIGGDGAATVKTVLDATAGSGRGAGTTLFGILLLLFAGASVFSQLQSAMNIIWEARSPESIRKGLLNSLKNQAFAFVMVIIFGFVLLSLLLTSAILPVFGDYLNAYASGFHYLVHLANIAVSVIVITILFTLIYKFLPNTPVAWRDAWPGAFLAALLFTAGKFGIGLYLGHSNIVSAYGASSSLVFLLLWIYYSSQTLFLGAEIASIYARERRG